LYIFFKIKQFPAREEEASMAVLAPQLGIRQTMRREAPVKQTNPTTLAVRSLEDRIREFARVANNGGTFKQLLERAKKLGISNIPTVHATIEASRPPMSTSKKVDIFMAMARKDDAKATDLLNFAEEKAGEKGIMHVRVVRDTIADVQARNICPKQDSVRSKVLEVGRFQRPASAPVASGSKKKKRK